jgi:3-oxoacyl-[acyl-carrier-protein] synthase II
MRTRVERRVVVTGLGLVTPLATGVGRSWERLLRGDTAVARCTRLPLERLARLPCQIAAEVTHGSDEGQFDLERWVPPELRRHTRPFVHYALAAGDAGWPGADSASAEGLARGDRAGVSVGTGMVDLEAVAQAQERLSQSYRKLSPFFIPSILGNMPAGHLSIQHGLRGPNHAPTTACTYSGQQACHNLSQAGIIYDKVLQVTPVSGSISEKVASLLPAQVPLAPMRSATPRI